MRHALDLRQLRALLRAYFRMSLRGKAVRAFYRRKPSKTSAPVWPGAKGA